MSEKRYTIARVDNSCPAMLDDFGCIIARNILHCKCGEDTKNYGDTKEQLIRKVAQEIFKAKLERYRRVWKCECSEMEKRERYKDSLALARKIVEFLGVME